jgi:hypothetical protein
LLEALATLYPVGPRVAWTYEALSDVEALLLPFVTSKSSTIPVGGATDPFALLPKRPTTSDPSTPVVSEGAAIKRVLAL